MMETVQGKKLIFLAVAVLGLACFPKIYAQNQPLIHHEFRLELPRLLEIVALDFEPLQINQQDIADREYQWLLEQENSLKNQANPQAQLLQSAYLKAVAISRYYLLHRQPKDYWQRLEKLRLWMTDFTPRVVTNLQDGQPQSLALYYNYIAQFGHDPSESAVIPKLIDLQTKLSHYKKIKETIDLFVAYSLILIPATRSQGLEYLITNPNSSTHGKLITNLLQLYAEFDFDNNQAKTGLLSARAIQLINSLLIDAEKLSPGPKYDVMNTILFLVLPTVLQSPSKVSLPLESFISQKPVLAYFEVQALQLFKAGYHQDAIKLYETIAKSSQNRDLELLVLRRLWEWEIRLGQNKIYPEGLKNRFETYEQYFTNSKVNDRKYRMKVNQLMKGIVTQYQQIMIKKLDQINHSFNQQDQIKIVNMVESFLASKRDPVLLVPIKVKLAQFYRQTNQYAKAVMLYLDLASTKPLDFIPHAIEAQSHLAQWPIDPPWLANPAPGPVQERTKLRNLYQQLVNLQQNQETKLIAQMGLLDIALGFKDRYENLWLEHVKVGSFSPNLNEISGYLLQAFHQEKRWLAVIRLSRVVIQRKLVPTLRAKPIQVNPLYSASLLSQAQLDFVEGRFESSTNLYQEFIRLFSRDPRVGEAYYRLSHSYHRLGQLVPALNSFRILIESSLNIPWRKQILLEGGHWAKSDPRLIEYSLYFFGKYLKEFPNESNIPEVRSTLADLYLKRKLYGWASQLYREQSLESKISPALQIGAAIRHMEIEEEFGSMETASLSAGRILSLAPPQSREAALANDFLGRYAAKRGDIGAMKRLEPVLLEQAQRFDASKESLGLIRFVIAEKQTKLIQNDESNLFLKDPEGSVKQYFELFVTERQAYLKVCQDGVSKYCAPAMFRLIGLSLSAWEAIDRIKIAETLGAERVHAFEVFKKIHMTKIEKFKTECQQRSLKLVQQGTTTELWKDEILNAVMNPEDQVAH